MVNVNPYEPTMHGSDDAAERRSRWWIAFSIFSSTIGIASTVLGLLVLNETIRIARHQSFDINIVYGLVTGTVFLLFGAAWIVAAWLHWRRRHRMAGALNLAAIAISFPVLGYLISL